MFMMLMIVMILRRRNGLGPVIDMAGASLDSDLFNLDFFPSRRRDQQRTHCQNNANKAQE